jgi:nicotinamidase-related amidase
MNEKYRAPRSLTDLVAPGTAAVLTQECQQGVIGPLSLLPQLAEAAAPIIPKIARLALRAREIDVPVVHALAASRADGRASAWNAPLYHLAARAGRPLLLATEAVDVVPEIGCDERDLVSTRLSGVGPMYDTGLESALRRLGVRTVIATGVSVNVGILDLVLDSVNAGFEVVVPRDAVAGVPAAYAQAVIDNTLRLLATVATTEDILSCWTDRR